VLEVRIVPLSTSHARLPTISVIVPCRDAAPFLDACVRSIRDQGVDGLELIVVDGGSTDGSVDVIRQHADGIAWWCSEPDRGPAHAVSKGLARAAGEVVAVLAADDLYLPGALAAAQRSFAAGADWVVGGVDFLDATGARWPVHQEPHARWTEWLLTVPVCQPGSFWRRTLLARCGELSSTVSWLWDYDLALRLYFDLAVRPTVLDATVASYRLHACSQTVRQPAVLVGEARRLRQARRRGLGPLQRARLRLAWWQRWQRIQLGCALRPGPARVRLRSGVLGAAGLGLAVLDGEAWRAARSWWVASASAASSRRVFAELDPW
jgi:glycosyltransferase involved in cell wall biosynthesis